MSEIFQNYPTSNKNVTKKRSSIKIQNNLNNLVSKCDEIMQVFPDCKNSVEYGSYVESVKSKHFNQTVSVLQSF